MVLKVFMLKNCVILYQIEQFSVKKPVDVWDKMKNIAECSKIKPWREISCLRSTDFLCILDWFWTENRVISLLDTDEISWNTLPMRNWHSFIEYIQLSKIAKYITYEELTLTMQFEKPPSPTEIHYLWELTLGIFFLISFPNFSLNWNTLPSFDR